MAVLQQRRILHYEVRCVRPLCRAPLLATQVVRFVGRVLRERQSSVNVVGIVLEERRSIAACKTANGVFAGVPVLQCPPGFGFICPVDFAESNILRSVRGGEAAWYCHSCHAPNVPPSVVSVMDYLELSLEALDALVRCSSCETVRVWYCPHPTCSGLAPLEVAQITERYDGVGGLAVSAMVETMTCPRCLRPPVATWSCPQCDKSNTGALRCAVCVCVCVRVCARVCVRACVRTCVPANDGRFLLSQGSALAQSCVLLVLHSQTHTAQRARTAKSRSCHSETRCCFCSG